MVGASSKVVLSLSLFVFLFLSSSHAKGIIIRTRVGLKNEAFTMLLIFFRLRYVYVKCCMTGAAPTSGGTRADSKGLPKEDGTAAALAGQYRPNVGSRDAYQRSISNRGKSRTI